MIRKGDVVACVMALSLILLVPSSTSAQLQGGLGGIAGAAKDMTGAVLPGVTVEASSPALIEKVRTATRLLTLSSTRET